MAKLENKIKEAFNSNPNLFCDKAEIQSHVGTTTEELALYGLERKDLKRMEKIGLALRGYKRVRVGQQEYTELRWILINKGLLKNGQAIEK